MAFLPLSTFSDIRSFVDNLEHSEIKPCINLVRYGIVPSPSDKELWATIPHSLFNKLFSEIIGDDLFFTDLGGLFFKVSTNPLISSTIISLCLAKVPTQDEITERFIASASKEVQVMESTARPPSINWKVFFEPTPYDCFVIPHQKTDCTSFIMKVNAQFRRFRDTISHSRLWPHGTNRGVSVEAQRSLEKLRISEDTSWMQADDYRRSITSLDIVKHFIRNGSWAEGACELKQKWYPSGLTPRTYFAQGGDAIRTSCYIRNFFNDFTDTYIPTDRLARVDGNRLICPDGGHFYIYDLTSFTSSFHEQQSFLRSMAEFFRETVVFLIGPKLSLTEEYLGDLIDAYCDTVNTLPPYTFHDSVLDFSLDSLVFLHHVAGFLGVPGNLASCTLAHGISVGVSIRNDAMQSCAGDDGNVGVSGEHEEEDVRKTIHLLGTFNEEKASSTKNTKQGSYLKRQFKQDGNAGILVDRVDFPLLGAVNVMQMDDPRFPGISNDRKQLRKSIATSMAKLFRDLYLHSQGYYLPGVLEFILLFIKDIYAKGALPTSGMVRNMYGSDLDKETFRIDAAVVFPASERYLRRDPDIVLTEDFLPWVVEVPVVTDEIIEFKENEDWLAFESRIGRSSPTLERLVKLGYLERSETERITLVGEEARRHFRRLTRSDFQAQEYVYTSLEKISNFQLKCIGLSGLDDFHWKELFFDRERVRIPVRHRTIYRDPDRVTDIFSESSIGLEDLY